jgi:hypothetical protein
MLGCFPVVVTSFSDSFGSWIFMGYTHGIIDPGMCTPDTQVQFRNHLSMLAQYHYFQDIDWFRCNADAGYELLVTYLDGEIVASSVLREARNSLIRKAKCIILNGPLARDSESLSVHLQALTEMMSARAVDVRISPPLVKNSSMETDMLMTECGFSRCSGVSGNYTSTVTVDLTRGIEAVKAAFSPALRRQIRKSGQEDSEVVLLRDLDALQEMIALVTRFSRSRRIGVPAPEVLDCYLRHKIHERGEGIALWLLYKGRPAAGIVVIGCGKRAIFSYSFREESVRVGNMPLTHILHYRAIRWALENGYSCYDFGGYDEERDDSTNNRFKLGFSRRIETLSENYIYSFHPGMTMLFNLLGRIRNQLSLG